MFGGGDWTPLRWNWFQKEKILTDRQ